MDMYRLSEPVSDLVFSKLKPEFIVKKMSKADLFDSGRV